MKNKIKIKKNEKNEISFRFNGKEIKANEGETIASAAYSSGIRVFSRSFKYHRPRGLFCVRGNCPNCSMRVNNTPNVRTCVTTVKEGMIVDSQNAWPSLNFDINRWIDHLSALFPVGFQYKQFIRPRFLWPITDKIIREIAGIGRIPPKETIDDKIDYETLTMEKEIAVIGGGISGMQSAIEASELGAQVIIIDDDDELGGYLRWGNDELYESKKIEEDPQRLVEELSKQIKSKEINVLNKAKVFGYFPEEDIIGIYNENKVISLKAKKIIVATGAYERSRIFGNNDLPGIFLSSGIKRLININKVIPGKEIAIFGEESDSLLIAKELRKKGTRIKAIIINTSVKNQFLEVKNELEKENITIFQEAKIEKANGDKFLKEVEVVFKNRAKKEIIKCDTLCIIGELDPANEILYQAGCKMKFSPNNKLEIERDENMCAINNVYAAGAAAGSFGIKECIIEGRIAGRSAATPINKKVKRKEINNQIGGA